MILDPKILKFETLNFGPFWTKKRLLSQCVKRIVASKIKDNLTITLCVWNVKMNLKGCWKTQRDFKIISIFDHNHLGRICKNLFHVLRAQKTANFSHILASSTEDKNSVSDPVKMTFWTQKKGNLDLDFFLLCLEWCMSWFSFWIPHWVLHFWLHWLEEKPQRITLIFKTFDCDFLRFSNF